MRNRMITTVLLVGATLAACDYNRDDYNQANAAYEAEGNYDAAAGGANYAANASGSWPEGARIVEEDGVYYRIDTGGTRIRLDPGDSTIIVEDGVRYRLDPGGTRIRISEEGAVVSVGPDGVETSVPVDGDARVTVNTN